MRQAPWRIRAITPALGPLQIDRTILSKSNWSGRVEKLGRWVTTTIVVPSPFRACQRAAERLFAYGIEVRVRFVEHQHHRVTVERAASPIC